MHEYSLYCMKLKLNESQEELRKDKKEEGLAEDSAPRENLYGIELPIFDSGYINRLLEEI